MLELQLISLSVLVVEYLDAWKVLEDLFEVVFFLGQRSLSDVELHQILEFLQGFQVLHFLNVAPAEGQTLQILDLGEEREVLEGKGVRAEIDSQEGVVQRELL